MLRKAEKFVLHEGDGDTSNSWSTTKSLEELGKETEGNGDHWKNCDYLNQKTVKIS